MERVRRLVASAFASSTVWALAGSLALAGQHAPTGIVQRIIDGDTLVVSGVGTVRLIGVDTPETVDPRKPVERLGREAAEVTRRLAEGRRVRLEHEGSLTDQYNRTLAYVFLPDGMLLNAELIRQGYAHAYTQFPFSRMEEFRALQREAMAHNRGLWAPDVERASDSTQAQHRSPPFKAAAVETSNGRVTVYATRTGTKYHREGCRHLARSQIPMPLEQAARRYGPCSVCDPPVLRSAGPDAAPAAAAPRAGPAPAKPSTVRPAQTSGRCQATTKKGTQCSRNAQPGRNYCWQH